jgi:hypothetical protein
MRHFATLHAEARSFLSELSSISFAGSDSPIHTTQSTLLLLELSPSFLVPACIHRLCSSMVNIISVHISLAGCFSISIVRRVFSLHSSIVSTRLDWVPRVSNPPSLGFLERLTIMVGPWPWTRDFNSLPFRLAILVAVR